jgi:hypothetical protein
LTYLVPEVHPGYHVARKGHTSHDRRPAGLIGHIIDRRRLVSQLHPSIARGAGVPKTDLRQVGLVSGRDAFLNPLHFGSGAGGIGWRR